MKVFTYPNQIKYKHQTVLILGSFETVHNGHFELIKEAQKHKGKTVIMMIEDPSQLPGAKEVNFTSLDIRLQQAANLNLDYALIVDFNPELRLLEGKEFIDKLIVLTGAKTLVFGEDFKAGRGGTYTAKDILKDFPNSIMVNHLKANAKKVSTSLLKEMIHLGEVDLVKKLSPYPYTLRVRVSAKDTFSVDKSLKMHPGIYAATIIVNDIRYWAQVHISQEQNASISVPDLNLKNTPYNGDLSFHKMIRIIISSKEDSPTKNDLEKTAFYLKNTL